MKKIRNIGTLSLDGGELCFDFINTVYAWKGENLHEYLGNYEDVIQWCRKVKLGDNARLKRLAAFAIKNQAEADKALRKMKQVRVLLYEMFSAIASNNVSAIPVNTLASFNKEMANALSCLTFKVKGSGLVQDWQTGSVDLLEPLRTIMKSAYDVLMEDDELRIKECPGCGWIFLDKTKNNKRNWCNQSCGSIDKSRRYYLRKKAGKV